MLLLLSSSMNWGGLGSVAAARPGDFGGVMVPSGWLVLLVLLPLVGAVLPRWLGRRTAPRVAVGALLGAVAVAAYLLFSRGGLGGFGDAAPRELVQPLWRVLALQRLELKVGLGLDRPAAVLLGVAALVAAWAVRTAARGQVAWLALAYAATAVALLGDNLLTRLIGWELVTVAGWGLGSRRAGAGLVIARVGDATLLVATALLFWGLGGSWSSSRLDARYQLDVMSAQSVAAANGAGPLRQAAEPGPTLELHSLRTQLNPPGSEAPGVPTVRATLYNKLWVGWRLLTWLGALFGLAAALKATAGALQLLGERRSAVAVRVWLLVAPAICAGHLLWSLQ